MPPSTPFCAPGTPGEIYNIGGGNELTNRDLTDRLLALAGAGPDMIEYVEDRLGHDRRYAVDSSKARSLGWAPEADPGRGPRRHLQLVSGQPLVVGAAEGAGRIPAREDPDHRAPEASSEPTWPGSRPASPTMTWWPPSRARLDVGRPRRGARAPAPRSGPTWSLHAGGLDAGGRLREPTRTGPGG